MESKKYSGLTLEIIDQLDKTVRGNTGTTPKDYHLWDFWYALSEIISSRIAGNWDRSNALYKEKRTTHYLSAEFLMGRSLLNNLVNLNLYKEAKDALAYYGIEIDDVLEQEYDAALGNGGLGRLAACFMDSCATLELPVYGYGILYRYGLFRQSFDKGFQKEHPDTWMEDGYPFIFLRESEKVLVHYNDLDVWAVPYDLPITGYGTSHVNTLKLWKAEPVEEFDYNLFSSQRFDDALKIRNRTQDIYRVLYPNDTTYDGKVLRVRQQYFFVSATLQHCVRRYKEAHGGDLHGFSKYNCFQLNDTHPVIAIPELMRILLDEYQFSWDDAWKETVNCFAYTNHTTLSEALEKWDISIFRFLFPRILEIITEIDRHFRMSMNEMGLRQDRIDEMAPLGNNQVRMAFLACYASFSINGVAALHTEILKKDTLKNWYEIWPQKFSNKTNGVTSRRWLRMINPELSKLLTELLGSEDWITDLELLKKLECYKDDKEVLEKLCSIKRNNKLRLAGYAKKQFDIDINPDSIFDVQIKRLHEYKRQLLNAFYILDLYFRLKDNPDMKFQPRVFIFGAKSAPGYVRAKAIIKFINEVGNLVNSDPETNEKIRLVFFPNYNVSKAELIIPAADISEQISTAGMEASGTSNMKFMMNGAVTLGTHDGANIEIANNAGEENVYFFGVRVEDLAATRAYYNPVWHYENVPGLKKVLDAMTDGTLNDNQTGAFNDLKNSLLYGTSWQQPDPFFVLGDFEAYRKCRDIAAADYEDRLKWAKKCWINIVNSGVFSSDRTIRDYVRDIWEIEPVPFE